MTLRGKDNASTENMKGVAGESETAVLEQQIKAELSE